MSQIIDDLNLDQTIKMGETTENVNFDYDPKNIEQLIINANFDYNLHFDINNNRGKSEKEMKEQAVKFATSKWLREKKGNELSFHDLYTKIVIEPRKQLMSNQKLNERTAEDKLIEENNAVYKIITLYRDVIKNIEFSYSHLKELMENDINYQQKKFTAGKKKVAWGSEEDNTFNDIFKNIETAEITTLTNTTKAMIGKKELENLNNLYDRNVEENNIKKKEQEDINKRLDEMEAKRQKTRGEFVSSTFTKEEEEYMKKIEEDRKKQEKENVESLVKFSHQVQPTRSVKLKNHSPTSSIETKSGAYEDIEDGEEDELDKKNNEIIKYKHIKNTKNNTGETIPYKAITNAFERRFQTMPITEINRIMEQEINNDVDIFDITKNDGIFEYQYMKTKHFECINIINVIDVNTYGKNLLDKIKGERKDIDEIMTEFTNKINNKINKKLKVPKARIYLRYINEDMGINVPYDDDRSDDFKWRAYSINPLNETTRNLNYTEHPLFYVKMFKDKNTNKYIFDKDNSEVVSEKKYMEKLTSELSDSKDQSLTTFLGGLGMGIVLDSWDWFCKGLDKDSCELYSFCMFNKNINKCELGQIANSTNQPYQGFNDDKLNIPNSQMLNTAWEDFKKCNTSITSDDEKGKIKCKIEDIFNFYEDENFNYDNYEILKGIIEEYKTKIKYISLNGYIKNYLEKIKNHISEENVNKEVIKILTNIDKIKEEAKNFEKNFESKILTYFADRVKKLFVKEQTESVANEFKNILEYVLGSNNVLSNGKNISDDLENLILNTIKDKLSEKGGFYRKYADQIAIIKTQLQNNKTLHNYLDDSKLSEVKEALKTLENQNLSSSDINTKMDEAVEKFEETKGKINSDHMKEYNKFINQYIHQVEEEIKHINWRSEFLRSISKINTHADDWNYIPENEITNKIKEETGKVVEATKKIKELEGKKINSKLVDDKITDEKDEEKKREKDEFEDKQKAKTYESIKNFKTSIEESKKKKKMINASTKTFITNILKSIDEPTIILKDDKYNFEKNDKKFDVVLKEAITEQDAIKISTKYEEAFNDEMDDLDDYIVLDEMTETTYKKEEGKLKKALLNLNTKKNNPHIEAYKKDVKDIDDLLEVFQNKINNVKEESVKTKLGKKIKELRKKFKEKQLVQVEASSGPSPDKTRVLKKKKKGKKRKINVLGEMNKLLSSNNYNFKNNGERTVSTLLIDQVDDELLRDPRLTEEGKNLFREIKEGWKNMTDNEKGFYTQGLIRKLYPDMEDFTIKLKTKK